MREYMASLRLLAGRDDEIYRPAHGPEIRNPQAFVRAFIAHREERERQIIAQIAAGHRRIADMVPVMYAAIDPRLYPAAARSVLAHLTLLVEEGRVLSGDTEARLDAEYRLP